MVDTTIMRDSAVGDQWIEAACAANPVQPVLDAQGNPTGNWLTGPVRLAFTDAVLEAKPGMKSDPNSKLKHSVTALFTPYTNMDALWDEFYRVAASDFPEYWNPHMNDYTGLDKPITDQGLKAKYNGFTPGLWCTNMTSQFPPPVTDTRGNPITDPKRVYPGVWAIISFNTYASGKNFPKKGPRFGLQAIVLIGDDKNVGGGGAVDPKTQFQSVKVQAPTAVPQAAFGAANSGPPAGRPPGAPGAAYYPPQGHGQAHVQAARPAAPPARPAAPPPAASDDDDMSQFM